MGLEIELYIDGGARGNPGPAGIGAVILDKQGEIIEEISSYIGETTNNVAEYSALLAGLRKALLYEPDAINIYSDSQLLVRQLNGVYKVRHENLKPLYAEAAKLLKNLHSYKLYHIPRKDNEMADRLVNKALDSREKACS